MDKQKITIQVICWIWPTLYPMLKEIAENTESQIDEWLLQILDGAIRGICNE